MYATLLKKIKVPNLTQFQCNSLVIHFYKRPIFGYLVAYFVHCLETPAANTADLWLPKKPEDPKVSYCKISGYSSSAGITSKFSSTSTANQASCL